VNGRADTAFRYGKIEVSPFAIRSAFATAPTVREYQVRQTPRGIDALVVVDGELRAQSLTDRLESILHTVGIHDPEVTIRRVASIERNPQTGKSRRFIAFTT